MSRLLEALARPPGSGVAVEDAAGSHDWASIRLRAARGSAALRARVHEGERVGLLLDPGADWVAALLAILGAGAAVVPLSPLHPPAERQALLDDAGASLVIGPGGLGWPELLAAPAADPPPPADASTALLLYTSGTTGRPKGAELSHAALAHQAQLLGQAWGLGAGTRLLHALPLHHMHGIAIALLPCLAAGGSVRMLPRFSAEAVWEELARASAFMAVPTMYHRLIEHFDRSDPAAQGRMRDAARALTLTTSGSAPLSPSLASRWEAIAGAIPLERYGMTETGVICSNPLAAAARRRGWVGPPLPTVEARRSDDGELEVRGPSLFSGYHARPEETRAALRDGWFRTGDVAELDGRGWVRLLGRRSTDILASGGYKLSALEIEEALREHPDVLDAAVVGLPDEALGERVAAAVVLSAGACLDAASLLRFAGERLARYKLPRQIAFVDELPRNALGKVQKREVTRLLTQSSP
jgi:malonyl-CoA/methylmalonyl-CoA synthetase